MRSCHPNKRPRTQGRRLPGPVSRRCRSRRAALNYPAARCGSKSARRSAQACLVARPGRSIRYWPGVLWVLGSESTAGLAGSGKEVIECALSILQSMIRSRPIVLKNSLARPLAVILESRRLFIALRGSSTNQSFARSSAPDFFNSIDPKLPFHG
jgi:hypothetical protein